MLVNDAFQKILLSPGALVQTLDGSFLLFTDLESESLSLPTHFHFSLPTKPKLFTPTFFGGNENPLKQFKVCLKFERNDLINHLSEGLNEDFPLKISLKPWNLQTRTSFDSDFKQIQHHLQEGLIDKAVIMTTEQNIWIPTALERTYLLYNLLKTCPTHLFIYGHWEEKSGVIGASPEYLFYRNQCKIQTMALAGTLAKNKINLETSKTPESFIQGQLSHLDFAKEILGANKKEINEHQFVVDDLTEKLTDLMMNPQASGPQVVEFPHLFHLQSHINAELMQLPEADGFDYTLIQKLHPTSALGLRSKKLHWHWLKNLQGHQKLGYFGAPVGYHLPEGFLCLVGIRNLEWDSTGSYLRAGCGIVALSDPDNEWQELESKRESVKSLLGLA